MWLSVPPEAYGTSRHSVVGATPRGVSLNVFICCGLAVELRLPKTLAARVKAGVPVCPEKDLAGRVRPK